MDKFMMLARRFTRGALAFVAGKNWDKKVVSKFNTVVSRDLLLTHHVSVNTSSNRTESLGKLAVTFPVYIVYYP